MYIDGHGCRYEVVIGLEVHAQLNTNSKLFSESLNEFTNIQNINANFLDIALPGTLPVVNKEAIQKAITIGIALNGSIETKSSFDRKHYFYPDLPQGYQITQFYNPIVRNGYIDINEQESKLRIKIERIHLEQDAGKLIHDRSANASYVDLNRAGIPLVEIVTEPDFRSTDQVVEYLKKLRILLRSVNVSDADMENGSFRCDANVSVRPTGSDKFGTRCEIKNLNSFKFIAEAIEYEAKRQVGAIEKGELISQETRLFDTDTGSTIAMRTKEDARDYRYFPDPDLLPIVIDQSLVDHIISNMPELPDAKFDRYTRACSMSDKDAMILVEDPIHSQYFDKILLKHDSKLCVTWINVELCGRINKIGKKINNCNVSTTQMIQLLDMIVDGSISGKMAKDVMDTMVNTGKDPADIVQESGMRQVSNVLEIEKVVDDIISKCTQQVLDYKSGKTKLLGFFVGEVMKATKGNANPDVTNDVVKRKLHI